MTRVYLIVKAHALRTRLCRLSDYERLLAGADLAEVGYADIASKYTDARRLAAAVYERFLERLRPLQKLDAKLARMVQVFAERLELRNLQAAACSAVGQRQGVALYPVYPYHMFVEPSKLARVSSLEDLLKILEGTPYHERVERCADLATTYGAAPLEAALEAAYWSWAREELARLRLGREVVRLAELEALIYFAYWALALERRGLSAEEIRAVLDGMVPDERLPKGGANAAVHALRTLAPRMSAEEARRLVEREGLAELLIMLRRHLYAKAREMALRYPISPVYVYIYLLACLTEAENLERIILGRAAGVPPSVLRKSLLLVWP